MSLILNERFILISKKKYYKYLSWRKTKEIILPNFFDLFHIIHLEDDKIPIINEKTNVCVILKDERITEYKSDLIPSQCLLNNITYSCVERNNVYVNFQVHNKSGFQYSTSIIVNDEFVVLISYMIKNDHLIILSFLMIKFIILLQIVLKSIIVKKIEQILKRD